MTDPPSAPSRPFQQVPPSDDQDLAILNEIRSGQFSRFDILVNRYKTPLVRYLLHQVYNMDAAEDLSQETFLRLFRSPPPLLHSACFSTWLFTIARHAAIDYLRVRRRSSVNHRRFLDQAPARQRPSVLDAATTATLKEEHARLDALVATLPPEQQEVVSLRFLAELSLEQIAQVTEAPLPTVKSRLRYALSKISQKLPSEERP